MSIGFSFALNAPGQVSLSWSTGHGNDQPITHLINQPVNQISHLSIDNQASIPGRRSVSPSIDNSRSNFSVRPQISNRSSPLPQMNMQSNMQPNNQSNYQSNNQSNNQLNSQPNNLGNQFYPYQNHPFSPNNQMNNRPNIQMNQQPYNGPSMTVYNRIINQPVNQSSGHNHVITNQPFDQSFDGQQIYVQMPLHQFNFAAPQVQHMNNQQSNQPINHSNNQSLNQSRFQASNNSNLPPNRSVPQSTNFNYPFSSFAFDGTSPANNQSNQNSSIDQSQLSNQPYNQLYSQSINELNSRSNHQNINQQSFQSPFPSVSEHHQSYINLLTNMRNQVLFPSGDAADNMSNNRVNEPALIMNRSFQPMNQSSSHLASPSGQANNTHISLPLSSHFSWLHTAEPVREPLNQSNDQAQALARQIVDQNRARQIPPPSRNDILHRLAMGANDDSDDEILAHNLRNQSTIEELARRNLEARVGHPLVPVQHRFPYARPARRFLANRLAQLHNPLMGIHGMGMSLPQSWSNLVDGKRPASLEAIIALNQKVIKLPPPASSAKEENESKVSVDDSATPACSICLSDFEDGEIATLMPCSGEHPHPFHKECLLPWLRKNNTCPTCRYEIETNDPMYNIAMLAKQQRERTERENRRNGVSTNPQPVDRDVILDPPVLPVRSQVPDDSESFYSLFHGAHDSEEMYSDEYQSDDQDDSVIDFSAEWEERDNMPDVYSFVPSYPVDQSISQSNNQVAHSSPPRVEHEIEDDDSDVEILQVVGPAAINQSSNQLNVPVPVLSSRSHVVISEDEDDTDVHHPIVLDPEPEPVHYHSDEDIDDYDDYDDYSGDDDMDDMDDSMFDGSYGEDSYDGSVPDSVTLVVPMMGHIPDLIPHPDVGLFCMLCRSSDDIPEVSTCPYQHVMHSGCRAAAMNQRMFVTGVASHSQHACPLCDQITHPHPSLYM